VSVPSSPRLALLLLVALAVSAATACGSSSNADEGAEPAPPPAAPITDAEIVRPPFAVRGELEGLLLVWFDAEGPHTAQKRSDIPEARRSQVRVDSLLIAPEARLDPAYVYLADVRTAGRDGSYVVRKVARESFEALLAEVRAAAAAAAAPPAAPPGDPNADVIVYGASWCGACRQAEAYLRSRNVPFVIKDIEHDDGAQAEMVRKAQAQGLSPTGIPVIDFRGHILLGFDQGSIDRLIASAPARPSAAPPSGASGSTAGARPI
jgi:glutaredoxin